MAKKNSSDEIVIPSIAMSEKNRSTPSQETEPQKPKSLFGLFKKNKVNQNEQIEDLTIVDNTDVNNQELNEDDYLPKSAKFGRTSQLVNNDYMKALAEEKRESNQQSQPTSTPRVLHPRHKEETPSVPTPTPPPTIQNIVISDKDIFELAQTLIKTDKMFISKIADYLTKEVAELVEQNLQNKYHFIPKQDYQNTLQDFKNIKKEISGQHDTLSINQEKIDQQILIVEDLKKTELAQLENNKNLELQISNNKEWTIKSKQEQELLLIEKTKLERELSTKREEMERELSLQKLQLNTEIEKLKNEQSEIASAAINARKNELLKLEESHLQRLDELTQQKNQELADKEQQIIQNINREKETLIQTSHRLDEFVKDIPQKISESLDDIFQSNVDMLKTQTKSRMETLQSHLLKSAASVLTEDNSEKISS